LPLPLSANEVTIACYKPSPVGVKVILYKLEGVISANDFLIKSSNPCGSVNSVVKLEFIIAESNSFESYIYNQFNI
jgi:hypothetical protein